MDDHGSHRTHDRGGVEYGPQTLPTWPSRMRSAGWLTVLTIGLGAVAALAMAAVAVLVWVMVSAAVT
jgi:hypothetical protein